MKIRGIPALRDRAVQNWDLPNWVLGNLICMFGVALVTKSGLGLSMLAAAPYAAHVALRDAMPWFTQGTAEYMYQGLVLIAACAVVRQFKPVYLLSFAEAVISGLVLDGWLFALGGNSYYETVLMRIAALAVGIVITDLGVAFFFRTDLPLQTYDFAVVKIAKTYGLEQYKVKRVFDPIMLGISLAVSLLLTHRLTGIGIGTVVITVVNAPCINAWGKLIDKFEKNEKVIKDGE